MHGVFGTPPEDLLDRPLIRPVASDKIAGSYRLQFTEEWTDHPVDASPEVGALVVGSPPSTFPRPRWRSANSGASSLFPGDEMVESSVTSDPVEFVFRTWPAHPGTAPTTSYDLRRSTGPRPETICSCCGRHETSVVKGRTVPSMR